MDHRNPKFNERVWCLLNHQTSVMINSFGETARFVNLFSGYSLKADTHNKKILLESRLAAKVSARPAKPPKKTKLEEFIDRNRHRNQHLYLDTAIEGIDYVTCPVSRARLRIIRRDYVEKVLGMTFDDYRTQHPDQQMGCRGRVQAIRSGLQKLDPDSGLTAHQTGLHLAKQTLNSTDPVTGLTGYQKIGAATRRTHMSNIDQFGRNGYQRQAFARVTTLMLDGRTKEHHSHQKRSRTISDRGVIYKRNYGASKLSKKDLAPIVDWLTMRGVKYYFDTNELVVRDRDLNRIYLYDLVCPELNLGIEYQSLRYHPWPQLSTEEWNQWREPYSGLTADAKKKYEDRKALVIEQAHGIKLKYVWEPTAKQDVEELLCFLKIQITKS